MTFHSQNVALLVEDVTGRLGYKNSVTGLDVGLVDPATAALRCFDTYSALRGYVGLEPNLVAITSTLLYGNFKLDALDTTSADNNGTIIVDSSGRRWKRIHEGVINSRWFGSKGDLVHSEPSYNTLAKISGTDDTFSIQAALTYCGNIVKSDKSIDCTGNIICFIPYGDYQITSTLFVPPNVLLHCEGWLFNFISDDWTYVVQGMRHSHCRKLQVHAGGKTGVLWGETGSSACASNLESIVVWNAGVGYETTRPAGEQKVGLRLRGLDFRIGTVWIKGGNVGLHGDGASDVLSANTFLIGCANGLKIDSGEQWSLPSVCFDTNIANAISIDNSNNIKIEAEAFINSDAYGTPMQAGVVIGRYTTALPCTNIRIKYAAQSTGGYGLIINQATDCDIDLSLTNSRTFSQTSGQGSATSHWTPTARGALLAHNIGTQYFLNNGSPTEAPGACIKYGSGLSGYINIRLSRSSSIVNAIEGTQYGNLREGM